MKMEAARFSETLVYMYQTIWRRTVEDCNILYRLHVTGSDFTLNLCCILWDVWVATPVVESAWPIFREVSHTPPSLILVCPALQIGVTSLRGRETSSHLMFTVPHSEAGGFSNNYNINANTCAWYPTCNCSFGLHASPSMERGRAVAQAVSRRLPTAAARIETRFWSCGIL
jgi:hypothetical protein